MFLPARQSMAHSQNHSFRRAQDKRGQSLWCLWCLCCILVPVNTFVKHSSDLMQSMEHIFASISNEKWNCMWSVHLNKIMNQCLGSIVSSSALKESNSQVVTKCFRTERVDEKPGCAKHMMTVVALLMLTFSAVLLYMQCMLEILLWCRQLRNKFLVSRIPVVVKLTIFFSEKMSSVNIPLRSDFPSYS